jgi:hypothetical protein
VAHQRVIAEIVKGVALLIIFTVGAAVIGFRLAHVPLACEASMTHFHSSQRARKEAREAREVKRI